MPDQEARSAAQGRLSDRAEYPKDCPNCGLWLTAESMDCPRCMAKLSPSSGAGSVGRSGDTDGLLPEGLVSPPASDSPAASPQVMREFYSQPFTEPDGSRTWCVREYVYGPDFFSRQIVSWHPTREEAQEEVERRYGR